MQFNSNRFGIPEVTRNIIAINVLLFIATIYGGDIMYQYLALFNYKSDFFQGWQIYLTCLCMEVYPLVVQHVWSLHVW